MNIPGSPFDADPKTLLDGQRFQQRSSLARYAGDGSRTVFALAKKPRRLEDIEVFLNGTWQEPDEPGTAHAYAWDGDRKITMHAAPANGARLILKAMGD